MAEVLNNGAVSCNIQRVEDGNDPIPATFNIFRLQKPPRTTYVLIANIEPLQFVTYIADESMRLASEDSGYYVNVFP